VAERERDWLDALPGAVTICDARGVILAMNQAAAQQFADRGGWELVGRSLLDCHPEPARSRVERLLRERQTNVYTIEKGGTRRLIYQAPWFREGEFAGLIELSLELPAEMPHFIRDAS
jgi:PAS domain-containing protein